MPSLRHVSRIALMFEQAFKNIDDVLRKEAGCTMNSTTPSRHPGCSF